MTAQLMLLKDTRRRACSPCAGDSAEGNGGDSGGCASKSRGTAAAAANAIIESDLHLADGLVQPQGIRVPAPLAEIMMDIDETNRLAALAATGDWSGASGSGGG